MSCIIECAGLAKVFSTDSMDTYALNNVDLQIFKGEFVAVTGPSGSGKSTLLSLLGLLDTPSEGRYVLSGVDVSNLSILQKARARAMYIGFVFQSFNLIPELTALENVVLPLTFAGVEKRKRTSIAANALEQVGIAHRLHHHPSQMSGGQQQRVAIARAICATPSIILADEPTGNLDSENGAQIMLLLRDLNERGSSIVMVTHDAECAKYASRQIRMQDGKITS